MKHHEVSLTPAGLTALERAAGQRFADSHAAIDWAVRTLEGGGAAGLTYELETRLHSALGITKVKPTAAEIVAAAEGVKRALAGSSRSLEADTELKQLRAEVAGLRSDLSRKKSLDRIASREAELDKRDAEEEAAYQRDFAFRFGQKPVV